MNGTISIDRLTRLVRATPEQAAAIDRILEAQPETRPVLPAVGRAGGFDEVESRLSLALDALLSAIDGYREQKKGRGV